MKTKLGIVAMITFLMLGLLTSPAPHAQVVKGQGLLEAGPQPAGAPPVSLFPSWYMDKTGLGLEPCLDGPPLCLSSLADFSNPAIGEAFYWSASADLTHPSGANGFLELALEAAFLNPPQTQRNAMIFNRLRVRIDALPAVGKYTIKHPFGQVVFTAVLDPQKGGIFINETIDLPGSAGQASFQRVMTSPNIGPFLKQVGAPRGHLGSPVVAAPVTGGPNGNEVVVTGPGGFTMSTNRFAVEGKIATNGGLQRVRANYSRSTTGAGTLNVFAQSIGFQGIFASRTGVPRVRLKPVPGRIGDYSAAIPFTKTQPFEPVTVRNNTDASKPVKTLDNVPDVVTINEATFTPGAPGAAGTLTVKASTSDELAPRPRLTLTDQAGTVLQTRRGRISLVLSTPVKPKTVQVTSDAGGSATAAVQ